MSKELNKMQFMPNTFIIENLQGILDSIELIEIRFAGIAQPDNFETFEKW